MVYNSRKLCERVIIKLWGASTSVRERIVGSAKSPEARCSRAAGSARLAMRSKQCKAPRTLRSRAVGTARLAELCRRCEACTALQAVRGLQGSVGGARLARLCRRCKACKAL